VLLLLALSVFINYLDRGNLSLAAPLLKNEFQLSATQLGILLPSFFWTYSFFLPVSGWLVDSGLALPCTLRIVRSLVFAHMPGLVRLKYFYDS
jgi:sugar phosphate permease